MVRDRSTLHPLTATMMLCMLLVTGTALANNAMERPTTDDPRQGQGTLIKGEATRLPAQLRLNWGGEHGANDLLSSSEDWTRFRVRVDLSQGSLFDLANQLGIEGLTTSTHEYVISDDQLEALLAASAEPQVLSSSAWYRFDVNGPEGPISLVAEQKATPDRTVTTTIRASGLDLELAGGERLEISMELIRGLAPANAEVLAGSVELGFGSHSKSRSSDTTVGLRSASSETDQPIVMLMASPDTVNSRLTWNALLGSEVLRIDQPLQIDITAGGSLTRIDEVVVTLQAKGGTDLIIDAIELRDTDNNPLNPPANEQIVTLIGFWTFNGSTALSFEYVRFTLDGVRFCLIEGVPAPGSWGLGCGPWNATPGAHSYVFAADPLNLLTESNEGNNSMTQNFTIDFDLVNDGIQVRTAPFAGTEITTTTTGTTVYIHGTWTVTANGTIATDMGPIAVDGDVQCNIGGFGGAVVAGGYWNYCSYTPTTPGSKNITWNIDPDTEIPESNESNNNSSTSFTVTGDALAPDITVTPNSLTFDLSKRGTTSGSNRTKPKTGSNLWMQIPADAGLAGERLYGHLWASWGDSRPGTEGTAQTAVFFTDEAGRHHSIEGSAADLAQFASNLDGSWMPVVLDGRWHDDQLGQSTFLITGSERVGSSPRGTTGSLPWVSILCRFGDDTGTTPEVLSWFETMMSNTSPGMDHFWRENSYDQMNLIGSPVVDWQNLPQAKAHYFHGSTTGNITVQGSFSNGATSITLATEAGGAINLVDGDVLLFAGDGTAYAVQIDLNVGASSSGSAQISPGLSIGLSGGEAVTTREPNGRIFFDRIAQDCATLADPTIDFGLYQGVNFIFNDNLDGAAWGGGICFSADGTTRCMSSTWMPPWGYRSHNVMGQEMGHGYGLPHSSGPYSGTYDSQWDTLSGGGTCATNHIEYGCIGVNTIMHHKNSLGWIAGNRQVTVNNGDDVTITIERNAQPSLATDDKLMAIIPIGGSATNFYTVEYRRIVGTYEVNLPREGVLIHKVDTTLGDRDAQVVDDSDNGDPNDDGAAWVAGETYIDGANGIIISVVSEGASSAVVRIQSGVSSQTFTVGNVGQATLNVSSITPASATSWVSTSPSSFSVAVGQTQQVSVAVSPSLAPVAGGTVRLNINSDDPDENPYPSGVDVTVLGEPGAIFSDGFESGNTSLWSP